MNNLCYAFAEQIKKHLNGFTPEIAIILGSGLGGLADNISDRTIIKYNQIEGFPQSTVSGHNGQFVTGTLQGKKVLCMQGRIHLYEGHQPQIINQIIKTFKLLGIKKLIVTNAAGSLNPKIPAGSIMLISDQINLSFSNPLVGPNNDELGPRFPDMSNAYDKKLRETATKTAKDLKIKLYEGTYLMVSGPTFETPAEVRAFGILGGDAVGMSTVPEVISAVHSGIDVLGFSIITNMGTGLQEQTQSHEETLSMAAKSTENLAILINNIFERI